MPPHKGNVTHHQDHSITPTNFNNEYYTYYRGNPFLMTYSCFNILFYSYLVLLIIHRISLIFIKGYGKEI